MARRSTMPAPEEILQGRAAALPVDNRHYVLGHPILPPFPPQLQQVVFAMGCFWGAERLFWELPGVWTTAAGYAGGATPNPTYEEVCTGLTGHAEAVRVVFDPAQVDFATLLQAFWENHDPTQGMRQHNDVGTQYRSAIFATTAEQLEAAGASRRLFAAALAERGLGRVTTEVAPAAAFYYAETYHQQYLAKNPAGYCGIKGTGVACPVGA